MDEAEQQKLAATMREHGVSAWARPAPEGAVSATEQTIEPPVNRGAIIALVVILAVVGGILAVVIAVHQHNAAEQCFWSNQYAGYSPADARALC
jgi:hypothetical protein